MGVPAAPPGALRICPHPPARLERVIPALPEPPMSVLPDHVIRRLATEDRMIEPFVETQKRDGVISYGLSSYGYDARVADEFKIFTNVDSASSTPSTSTRAASSTASRTVCIIPPN